MLEPTSSVPAAPATVRVLVNAAPGGFSLKAPVLHGLWTRAPHYFDEALPAAEFVSPEGSECDLEQQFPNSVLVGADVYFLKAYQPALRSDPGLVALFETEGTAGLAGLYCHSLKLVEVPADAQWHVWEAEDGTESIHEDHRVWN